MQDGGDIDYQKTADEVYEIFIGPPPSMVTGTVEENEPERRNYGMHNLCNSL
ncbi:hypothetical protein HHI36_000557, partial [Cryptolaemus montrouzieri]